MYPRIVLAVMELGDGLQVSVVSQRLKYNDNAGDASGRATRFHTSIEPFPPPSFQSSPIRRRIQFVSSILIMLPQCVEN